MTYDEFNDYPAKHMKPAFSPRENARRQDVLKHAQETQSRHCSGDCLSGGSRRGLRWATRHAGFLSSPHSGILLNTAFWHARSGLHFNSASGFGPQGTMPRCSTASPTSKPAPNAALVPTRVECRHDHRTPPSRASVIGPATIDVTGLWDYAPRRERQTKAQDPLRALHRRHVRRARPGQYFQTVSPRPSR